MNMTRTLPELLDKVQNDTVLFNCEGAPFSVSCTPGMPDLAIVVGDNASGKSLLHRCVDDLFRMEPGCRVISIFIRERTAPGMVRGFVFGDEDQHSTGANSVRTLRTAFKQAYDRPWMLLLDEPETGLSEGYAEALGELIAEACKTRDASCQGVMVVTHSRRVVTGIKRRSVCDPTFVIMEPEPISIDTWLERRDVKSLEDLQALGEISHERFIATHRLLNRK